MLRVPIVEVTVCESQVILFDHSHKRNAQQSVTYRGALLSHFLLKYYVTMCLLWVYLQPKTLEPNEQKASYESQQKGDPMRRANLSPHTFRAQPLDQFL